MFGHDYCFIASIFPQVFHNRLTHHGIDSSAYSFNMQTEAFFVCSRRQFLTRVPLTCKMRVCGGVEKAVGRVILSPSTGSGQATRRISCT